MDSREQEQKQNKSVASRVERGLHLVAGGGSRLGEARRLPVGNGDWNPAPEAPPEAWPEAGNAALCPLPGTQGTLSELFPRNPRDAGWTGFVVAQLDPARPLLWVQERMAIVEGGRVHPAGLGALGDQLIHVEARDSRSALWAMEEGLRCSSLGGVIGELWGDPAALDFTATRRLAVAAERTGVACWLVRSGGGAGLSGARERWRLGSAPSADHPFDPKAPGSPRWEAGLFRSRHRPPGTWLVNSRSLRLHEAQGDPADGILVAAEAGDRALGDIVRRAG